MSELIFFKSWTFPLLKLSAVTQHENMKIRRIKSCFWDDFGSFPYATESSKWLLLCAPLSKSGSSNGFNHWINSQKRLRQNRLLLPILLKGWCDAHPLCSAWKFNFVALFCKVPRTYQFQSKWFTKLQQLFQLLPQPISTTHKTQAN